MGLLNWVKRWTIADSPTEQVREMLSAPPTATGVAVSESNALRSASVYACTRVIAEGIASLPCITYRRLPGGGKERADDLLLYPVLRDSPNPEMTAFTFWETVAEHLNITGNGYAEIATDGAGRFRELWPLLPDRTYPRRNPGTGKLEYVTRLANGENVVLPAWRVLHIPGLSFDGIKGLSPIGLMRESVGFDMAVQQYGSAFFGNGARPGGVLEHPGKLSPDAKKNLKESWRELYQGLTNAQRVALLEEGVQFKPIAVPPEDAQFLDTRRFSRNEIAMIFRVPPHLIADLSAAKYANIEHQGLDFVIHTLRPWLTRVEQALKAKLFPGGEGKVFFAEFLVDGLLRGDLPSRYRAYSVGRMNGWLNVNEIRAMENMNPLPGDEGNIYIVPKNMTTPDKVGEEPAAPAAASDDSPGGVPKVANQA